jgi:chromosome segregation ATPase
MQTSTRDSNAMKKHQNNNNDQVIILMQEEIDSSNTEISNIKMDINNLKKDYTYNIQEQQRDKKELETALTSNLAIVASLNESITKLSDTIKDPINGLIVKLNRTVETAQESLKLFERLEAKYKKDLEDLTKETNDLKSRVEKTEATIEFQKKISWYAAAAIIVTIVKAFWDVITKGV